MSCNIARRSKKLFVSKKLKSSYHFDKTDPNNLVFPLKIDNINSDTLNKVMSKIINRYKHKEYKNYTREKLDDDKSWNNLYIIFLLKFYKNGWSIQIEDEEDFFPSFVFTFNPKPLKKKIDLIVSYFYDHIEEDSTRENLENSFFWSALDLTHLLHYFVISHPDYKDSEF